MSQSDSTLIEPLLDPANSRFTFFPILHPDLHAIYKKQQNLYWRAEEIDFSQDCYDFEKLTPNEKLFIEKFLALFAGMDGIVNFNNQQFLKEITCFEAQVIYGWQYMMENIHSETYSLMLNKIIKDQSKQKQLFNSLHEAGSIKNMADWALKWSMSDASFQQRLVAFAIVEGLFFSGAFASIFWLKTYRADGNKRFMDGLIKSNEFISRDEGMHCEFACQLYSKIVNKLPKEVIEEMFDDACKICDEITIDALPCNLIGMNQHSMKEYYRFVADELLCSLGYTKKYFQRNPFDFMTTIGMTRKTSFFESRPTEYQSAESGGEIKKQFKLLTRC